MVALILAVAEVLGDLVPDDAQALLPLRGAVPHHADDFLVDLRVERREGQVLQFPLDGVHAQPVRQRGEDLQGFAGFAGRGFGGDEAPGAGVVQPVGQLDHQDADVLGHGHNHLADGLGLGGLAEADLVQLGDAVHQHGDFGSEVPLQVRQGVRGVLHGVVEQRRRQGGAAEAQLGQDGGHGHGMGDVGIAAFAFLPAVAAFGDVEGPLDEVEVLFGVVGPDGPQQRFKDGRIAWPRRGRSAGQAGNACVRGGPGRWAGHPELSTGTAWPGRAAGDQPGLRTLARTVVSVCRWRRRRTFFQ